MPLSRAGLAATVANFRRLGVLGVFDFRRVGSYDLHVHLRAPERTSRHSPTSKWEVLARAGPRHPAAWRERRGNSKVALVPSPCSVSLRGPAVFTCVALNSEGRSAWRIFPTPAVWMPMRLW